MNFYLTVVHAILAPGEAFPESQSFGDGSTESKNSGQSCYKNIFSHMHVGVEWGRKERIVGGGGGDISMSFPSIYLVLSHSF